MAVRAIAVVTVTSEAVNGVGPGDDGVPAASNGLGSSRLRVEITGHGRTLESNPFLG